MNQTSTYEIEYAVFHDLKKGNVTYQIDVHARDANGNRSKIMEVNPFIFKLHLQNSILG